MFAFSVIVSRFPNEFIVKLLIIRNTESRHIYILTERRGERASCRKDQGRECVRDREWLQMGLALVVKTAIGETDHFGII